MPVGSMTEPWSMPVYGVGPPISDDEYQQFRDYIANLCGIVLDSDKKYFLESRLAPLLAESNSDSYGAFFAKATTDSRRWRERIIECMMTNETLWFRDPQVWDLLRDKLLPELARRARHEKRRPRVWSAGCSTGQEPYSLAMLIDHLASTAPSFGASLRDFDLLGTDISRAAIILARAARYDPVSMRRGLTGKWEPFRQRYFEAKGRVSALSDSIKEHVRLEKLALQERVERLGKFDMILLRYVAIYFSQEFKCSLYRRLASALNPGGILLLGSAEMMVDNPGDYTPERHGQTYIYRSRHA